jgi:competence protein ComEA
MEEHLTLPSESNLPVEKTAKINLNRATMEELMQLPGIGETLAKQIIDYRQTHGKFQNSQDPTKVKGIGQKTVDKLTDKITLSSPNSLLYATAAYKGIRQQSGTSEEEKAGD